MKYKPILIVLGEPNSVFLEIFFKSIKHNKYNSPLILIGSKKIIKLQMKKLNYDYKINECQISQNFNSINNKCINVIDVDYNSNKVFEKISNKSKKYIDNSFDIALRLLKKKVTYKLINGPISKKHFLDKKTLGVTEYLANKTNTKIFAMLIYHHKLSVSPITTHLPIKLVAKNINKKKIVSNTILINSFYKKYLNKKARIAVTGLNPHCESVHFFNEDSKILIPTINYLKKKINISGPFSADTLFMKKNRNKFNVIIGMYHDQVLTPVKTLFEYDAINITLGLPFIRVSPDHGPNEKMMGKNISNPKSLINSLNFLDKK